MNFFVTTIASLAIALATGKSLMFPALQDISFLSVLLFAGIFLTLLTFGLLQWILKHISASTASLKDYIQLIVGFGLNAAILGESLTVYYFLGSILVIAGVVFATQGIVLKKLTSMVKKNPR